MTDTPPLEARAATHGDYTETAQVAQHLKTTLRNARNWNRLSNDKREALDMIMSKVARIMSGEPNEPDHWVDIEGYARLARDRLSETQAAREARMSTEGHRVTLSPAELDKRLQAQREQYAEEQLNPRRVTPTVLVKPWDKKQ